MYCISFLKIYYGNTTNFKLYCIKEGWASFSQSIKSFTGQFLSPRVDKKSKSTVKAQEDLFVPLDIC